MAKDRLTKGEQNVQNALLKGDYEEAQRQMNNRENNIRPVYRAIFEASLAFGEGDDQKAWREIAEGLKSDGRNYELYVMLGEYYMPRNPQQAYLCYENALFYCDDEEDSGAICRMLSDLSEEGVSVPKTAIVILSYNLLGMTRECIESIRKTTYEDTREIIVVDNASSDGSAEWLRKQKDIKLLCNKENTGFPAGCNQGIELAEKDADILLLNNDTVMTDNALFWLRMGLYEKKKVGSTGCVSNYVSNLQAVVENGKSRQFYLDFARENNVPFENPYLPKVYLVGFALLLKRTVLDKIGLLDERFSPGNYEDNDICLRIGLAGYSNVLCKNSFIIHWGSQSFGSQPQKHSNLISLNEKKFYEKWSFIRLGFRDYWITGLDHLSVYDTYCASPKNSAMVIGTGCGAFLSILRDRYPGLQLYGIEQNHFLAQVAGGIADIICADLDSWQGDSLAESFDVIFLTEAPERMRDFQRILRELAKTLKKDGHLIAAFLNKNHFLGMTDPNRNAELFDQKRIVEVLDYAGLCVNTWGYQQMTNMTVELEETIDKLQTEHPEISREDLLTYQWLIVADRQRTDIRFDGKMAVCIPTYQRPEVIEDVLFHCAETYKRYGLDVYYYDSSEDDNTRKVIESYQSAGYDNLYCIRVNSKISLGVKLEHVMMMRSIKKEYEYMWYLRDRCWCEEKTLRLMYRAMEDEHDLIFLDVGHPDEEELLICNDADAFYHRCGDYATSMDTAIYNVKTMLKDDFSMKEFKAKYDWEYRRSFQHFLLLFEQLSKKEKPDICLLSGKNMAVVHSRKGSSTWSDKRLEVWAKRWVQANEALPVCYTDREDIIKRTASFPWILGDINILVDLHNKRILTPEYYEEIKNSWERVSDIPLEILRQISYGEYSNF